MEDYSWVAETTDKKILTENGNGPNLSKTLFSDVAELNRQGKIKYFMINPNKKDLKRYVVKLGGKRELIFWRRRMNYVSNKGKFMWTLYILGWKDPVRLDGELTKLYKSAKIFIYPNGSVEMNNDEPTMAKDYHSQLVQEFENLNPSEIKNEN